VFVSVLALHDAFDDSGHNALLFDVLDLKAFVDLVADYLFLANEIKHFPINRVVGEQEVDVHRVLLPEAVSPVFGLLNLPISFF